MPSTAKRRNVNDNVPARWCGTTSAANCSLNPSPNSVVCVSHELPPCPPGARPPGFQSAALQRRQPRRRRRHPCPGRGCRRPWRTLNGCRRRRRGPRMPPEHRRRDRHEACRHQWMAARWSLIAPPPLFAGACPGFRRHVQRRARQGRRRCAQPGPRRCGRPRSHPGHCSPVVSSRRSMTVATGSPRGLNTRSVTVAGCGRVNANAVDSRPAANGLGKLM